MHFSKVIVSLALASPSWALRGRDETVVATAAGGENAGSKRYILEFADGIDSETAINEINSRPGTKVLKVFDNAGIFSGVSIEGSAENLDSLNAIGVVSRVWPSKKLAIEPAINLTSYSETASAFDYSVHGDTGVDKLHEAGIFGKGAIIAVVDTGIYYPHPEIGGGYGPGFKVAGGYDFVGDGLWPFEGEKEPDDDPLDYHGHGTHVAGIIAGKGPRFTGVAPEATLLAYKVCTTGATTDEDTLIEAFLHAYNAGVDIITASISGYSGWEDNAWALVADRIVDAGVVVTLAAGNNGEFGPFMGGDGASGKNVLAVASFEPSSRPMASFNATFKINGTEETTRVAHFPLFKLWPSTVKDYPFFYVSNPCEELPADTPNLADMVVIFKYGQCDPSVKESFLKPLGVRYIMWYISSVPDDGYWLDDWTLNSVSISTEAGEAIVAALADGYSVTATIPPSEEFVAIPNDLANTASFFTSFGGSYDMSVKPDIAAPGSSILSLFLNNGYAIISGTSMATPYVAGVAALYIGKFGGRAVHGPGFAKMLQARIVASGEALPWGSQGEPLTHFASTTQVGNGKINATKVLTYETQLSFSKFALNDTHHFSRYHGVDIMNHGSKPVTYSFEIQPAGGYEAWWPNPEDAYAAPRIRPLFAIVDSPLRIAPGVTFPSGKFVLQPGQTKKAEFIFKIPEGLNAEQMPLYSGKILIKGTNGEQLSVPYFGAGCNTKKTISTIWLTGNGWPFGFSTNDGISFEDKPWFTFNLSLAEQDFPRVLAVTTFGTRELRWDIFEENWTERKWVYPPVVGQNGFVGSATSFVENYGFFDPAVDSEDNVVAFPFMNIARNVIYEFWWLGKLAGGGRIPPGKYRMRIAALYPFGTPSNANNWDVWETPMIEVRA